MKARTDSFMKVGLVMFAMVLSLAGCNGGYGTSDSSSAGGELRLGTTSMYMGTEYTIRFEIASAQRIVTWEHYPTRRDTKRP
jgi:hypothetical protein